MFVSNVLGNDADTISEIYRNPIYIKMNGVAVNDLYRVEIVTGIEFIPTLTFAAFSAPSPSKVTVADGHKL